LLTTLQEAIQHGDALALQRAAHSLKSSSGSVGAMALAALCSELEMMGRSNTLVHAATLPSQVESAYAAVHAALTQELYSSTL
jgi:HPt (histidine-containing phosphotransfer) domain-containing protein